jgi:hypothetical protein
MFVVTLVKPVVVALAFLPSLFIVVVDVGKAVVNCVRLTGRRGDYILPII